VTYLENGETERTVSILGIDEVDTAKQEVSWVSPIARILLKNRVGEKLLLPTPSGVVGIEILAVSYPRSA
jgi:transcription elongation factor GreB